MTISKETIEKRKEDLKTEFTTLKDRISMGEKEIETMKKNLDALAGAVQQCDLFLKEFEDKTPKIKEAMPAAKQEALADNLKETRASSAQENLAKTIEGLQARGRTIASEQAGLTGGLLLRDVERQTANARESINQELESFSRQYGRNREGLIAQRDNRRNQLQSNINQAYNQIPSLGSIILNTATQGLNSYAALA